MRIWPGSAVVCSGLAAAIAGGCGGSGNAVASPEGARACLEAGGADVLSPPLGRFDDLASGLELSEPFSTAHAGLPSGGVAAVGFFHRAEDAAAARAALEGVASLGGAESMEAEFAGNALVAWRRPAGTGDRDLLLSCLESGGDEPADGDTHPANPLGCVRVFLAAGATRTHRTLVEDTLLGQPATREVRFVSKGEALEALRKRNPELTQNLHGNPLPDSFEAGPTRGKQAPSIAAAVRGARGVEHVSVSSVPCSVSTTLSG